MDLAGRCHARGTRAHGTTHAPGGGVRTMASLLPLKRVTAAVVRIVLCALWFGSGMSRQQIPNDDSTAAAHAPGCSLSKALGCFNDSSCASGDPHCAGDVLLPKYQPQLHDKVTLEDCALAVRSSTLSYDPR